MNSKFDQLCPKCGKIRYVTEKIQVEKSKVVYKDESYILVDVSEPSWRKTTVDTYCTNCGFRENYESWENLDEADLS